MIWQVCVLDAKFEKLAKKGKLASIPTEAWNEKEKVVARSYVRADEKAKRNHPNKIVHTYTTN